MENNTNLPDTDKKTTNAIVLVNFCTVALMALMCFSKDLAFFAFALGMFAGITNFVLMIVFITQRKTQAYIVCLISMLLLPIIGFGCCAAGM
jgi:tellurite resistance protein TehA-like permease